MKTQTLVCLDVGKTMENLLCGQEKPGAKLRVGLLSEMSQSLRDWMMMDSHQPKCCRGSLASHCQHDNRSMIDHDFSRRIMGWQWNSGRTPKMGCGHPALSRDHKHTSMERHGEVCWHDPLSQPGFAGLCLLEPHATRLLLFLLRVLDNVLRRLRHH